MNSKRMDGKKVLVTGAGTGIGRGVALEFAREGAHVALHYSHSDQGAKSAVEEIRKFGGTAEAFGANYSNIDTVKTMVNRAVDFLGGIDVLVNNAGITTNKPFLESTPELFDLLYGVNVRGMFFVTQTAAARMVRQQKGVIINMTSVHNYGGMPHHTVYAGTKGAIATFTRTLAVELAPQNIRVVGIAPGWILVENQIEALGPDFDEQSAAQVVPVGFIGRPVDVAKLAIFLASDDARFITGQTYLCDGGQMAVLPGTGDFRKPTDVVFGKKYIPGT